MIIIKKIFKKRISNFQFPVSNRNGFTLIELIVSISIITILIGIFLTNYRSGGKRTELIMTAQKMVTDIRMAQNNTLGSVEYNSQIPSGGWGIYINTTEDDSSYLMFADDDDINENSEYDVGEGDTALGARRYVLPRNIIIDSIDIKNIGITDNVHITFVPPDPITVIYDTFNTSTEVTITLKETRDNSTKDILMNSFGMIEVVDEN